MERNFLDIEQYITGSSLDLDGIRVIQEFVQECRPKTILELGSGVSTLAFAQVQSSFEFLFSVDDSAEYLEISKNRIPERVQSKMKFIHAPISKFSFKGCDFETYNHDAIYKAVDRPIDLLFIDGPYARRYGRTAVLPLVHNLLSSTCMIILDDANRETELEAINVWQKVWGEHLKLTQSHPFRKGLKIFELRDPQKITLAPFGLKKWIKSILK